MKKIFVLILVVGVLLSTLIIPGPGVSANTLLEISEDDITFLNMLGIVQGYEDGSLHPEYNITRMEYTALIVRCLGINHDYSNIDSGFSDVPDDLWGAGYIAVAHNLGLIDGYGNGKFGPNDLIKEVDAVKIIVDMLGYGPSAKNEGGYPEGYISIALKNKILSSSASREKAATRGYISELLVNSLSIPMIAESSISPNGDVTLTKSDETILSKLDITRLKGVLEAVYGLNISSQDNVKKDELIVSGQLFKTKNTVPQDYVGDEVEIFVYDLDGADETVYAVLLPGSSSRSIRINAEDISDNTTFSQMHYTENGKRRNVSLASNLKIIYNGMVIDNTNDYTVDKIMPEKGYVKLCETDGANSGYDIVFVKDYRTFVVNSIKEDALFDIYGSNFKYDAEDISLTVFKDGKYSQWSEIKPFDVVDLALSLDGSIGEIIISREKADVEIDAMSQDDDSIYYWSTDNDSYKTTREYNEARNNGYRSAIDIENGKYYVFYLDSFGNIAYAQLADEMDETENKDVHYAFVINAGIGKHNIKSTLEMEVLDESNRFTYIETVNSRLTFGRMEGNEYIVSKVEPREAYDKLISDDMVSRQLIKSELEKEGLIKKLFLEDTTTPDSKYFSKKANDESKVFSYNTINNKYFCDENTKVFLIPSFGRDETLVRSGKIEDFFSHNSSYTIELWDVGVDDYVPCILYTTTAASTTSIISEDEYWIDYLNSPVLFVTQVRHITDDEGMEYVAVEGYENKKKVTRLLSDTLSSNLLAQKEIRKGAIIQYTSNKEDLKFAIYSEDVETIQRYVLMFDATDYNQNEFMLSDYKDVWESSPRIRFGYTNVEKFEYPYFTAGGRLYAIHDGTVVYVWDSEEMTFKKTSSHNITVGEKVFIRSRYNNMREIVIFE